MIHPLIISAHILTASITLQDSNTDQLNVLYNVEQLTPKKYSSRQFKEIKDKVGTIRAAFIAAQ